MRAIWGTITEIRDLGVVAEYCPYCERLMSCLLRSVCRGDYILFLKVTEPLQENSCLCTGCLKPFPCIQWRYAAAVPVQEAKTLPLDDLLTRTNPVLALRIQFKEQVGALGGDNQFADAYQCLEAMRPGVLRSQLLRELLSWNQLTEEQRTLLTQQIGARSRAWHFAEHIAAGFPESGGCMTQTVAALVVGMAFLLIPAIRDWRWVIVAITLAVIGVAFINYVLMKRRVTQWTHRILVPEAVEAGVPLDCFLAVVNDISGSRLNLTENLWPMKQQLESIRAVLNDEGKLSKK